MKYRLENHVLPADVVAFKGENNKYHVLYVIQNKINGKEYYGVFSKTKLYNGYAGSGRLLEPAYSRYGITNFVMYYLAFFQSRNAAGNAEAVILDEDFITSDYCKQNYYNLKTGGFGGFKLSPDARLKMKKSPEQRAHMRELSIIRYKDPAEHERSSQQALRQFSDPAARERHRQGCLEVYKDPKARERISKRNIERFKDPALRVHASISNKLRWQDPEYRAKRVIIAEQIHQRWQDPEYRATHCAIAAKVHSSEQYRHDLSLRTAARWTDPAWRARTIAANGLAHRDPEYIEQARQTALKAWAKRKAKSGSS